MNKLELFKEVHTYIAENLNDRFGICILISRVCGTPTSERVEDWKNYCQNLDWFQQTQDKWYWKYILFGKHATPGRNYWWKRNVEGNTMRLCYVREIVERLQFEINNPNPSWLDLIKLELQQFNALLNVKLNYE